jgi:hypothetical protein
MTNFGIFADLRAWHKDPDYFEGGLTWACTFGVTIVPVLSYDPYIPYGSDYTVVPYADCYQVFDPDGYSVAAAQIGAILGSIDPDGLIPESPDAEALEAIMESLYGVDFMGNSLSNSFAPMIWEVGDLAPGRWLLLLEAHFQGALWLLRLDYETGPHEFDVTTEICNVNSDAGCTEAAVWLEVKKLPVTGHLEHDPRTHRVEHAVPVIDGEITMVEGIFESDFRLDNVGKIYHDLDEGNHVLTNVTMDGHAFHPSTITRTVSTRPDGTVIIETHGEGQNGGSPYMNEAFGPPAFRGIDWIIKERVLN